MPGLSDQKLKDRLKDRLDVMLFAGRDLHTDSPDETTHIRFRTALVAAGACDARLAEVCAQIEGQGLKGKLAETAIIDAAVIKLRRAPAAALSNTVKHPTEDRAGEHAPDPAVEVKSGADQNARRIKKSPMRHWAGLDL